MRVASNSEILYKAEYSVMVLGGSKLESASKIDLEHPKSA